MSLQSSPSLSIKHFPDSHKAKLKLWIFDQSSEPRYSGLLEKIDGESLLLANARIHQGAWEDIKMDMLYLSVRYIKRIDFQRQSEGETENQTLNWKHRLRRWLWHLMKGSPRQTIIREKGELDLSSLQP